MKKILAVLLCLGLVGCAMLPATVPNLNGVSLGMTKAEVIQNVGVPESASAQGNVEYLKYICTGGFNSRISNGACYDRGGAVEYFVRLVNGKVESYGKVGDFDSAKNPALDINANVNSGSK